VRPSGREVKNVGLNLVEEEVVMYAVRATGASGSM